VLIADDSAGQAALDDLLLLPNYLAVNRHTALGNGPVPRSLEGLLALEATGFAVPAWLKSRIFPEELSQACASLLEDLTSAGTPPQGLDPMQAAALRTLVVHRWRRVVLRHPDLPGSFHPADWPGEACRTRVFAWLDALPRPSPAALNAAQEAERAG
jgi:phenylacetic acid degradation operon negative regulatory protein